MVSSLLDCNAVVHKNVRALSSFLDWMYNQDGVFEKAQSNFLVIMPLSLTSNRVIIAVLTRRFKVLSLPG